MVELQIIFLCDLQISILFYNILFYNQLLVLLCVFVSSSAGIRGKSNGFIWRKTNTLDPVHDERFKITRILGLCIKLCLNRRTTVTSLSAPKDTDCKTHPLFINHGVPFRTRLNKNCMRDSKQLHLECTMFQTYINSNDILNISLEEDFSNCRSLDKEFTHFTVFYDTAFAIHCQSIAVIKFQI